MEIIINPVGMASWRKTEVAQTDLIRPSPRAFGSPINQSTSTARTTEDNLIPTKRGKGRQARGGSLADQKENVVSAAITPLKRGSEIQMTLSPQKRARPSQSPLNHLSENQTMDKTQSTKRAERLLANVRWMKRKKEKLREKERLNMEKEREEMAERRRVEEHRQIEEGRRLMEEGRRLIEQRRKNELFKLNLGRQLVNGLPNWAETPTAALSNIFEKLGAVEFCAAAQAVCRLWRYLPLSSPLPPWIDMRSLSTTRYQLTGETLARRAVDCTTGPIEQLHVMEVSDAFLTQVGDRCYNLKSFSLIRCRVSPKVLLDFLLRCPLLEELNIYWALFLHNTYGHIGQVCPQLKCLSIDANYNDESNIADSDSDYRRLKKSIKSNGVYDDSDTSDPDSDDDAISNSESFISSGDRLALEIASHMPQLRELRIRRNLMLTNKGLHFILEGCPHLEFLELRCCYYIRVDDVLHAKLNKIKTVKLSRRSVRVLSKLLGKQLFV